MLSAETASNTVNTSNGNVTTEKLGADANFALSPTARLGVGLGLTTGSDSNAKSSYKQNSTELRLLGGISF